MCVGSPARPASTECGDRRWISRTQRTRRIVGRAQSVVKHSVASARHLVGESRNARSGSSKNRTVNSLNCKKWDDRAVGRRLAGAPFADRLPTGRPRADRLRKTGAAIVEPGISGPNERQHCLRLPDVRSSPSGFGGGRSPACSLIVPLRRVRRMCWEESPDTAGHGSLRKEGRVGPYPDATDSVTENRLLRSRG